MKYPVRVTRYQIRSDSAGVGKFCGGEGLIREYEFLAPAQVTILSERRKHSPWGLKGGGLAAVGNNQFNGKKLSSKESFNVKSGDVISLASAGGGGYGKAAKD
jgi:N-methylhydantoinase B